MPVSQNSKLDVVVIGGGQSALTVAYFLKRTGISYVLLDAESAPGGAWRHGWDSLRLFSPSAWSSIAGWPMPAVTEETPHRDDVIDYLTQYERRYGFPIIRSTRVTHVESIEGGLRVFSGDGHWDAKAVISATGTWSHPVIPAYPDQELFEGRQIHSALYVGPSGFEGKTVLVVGGGNSGAQIYAEISKVASATWVTQEAPKFLPDEVDGRVLFERATARLKAQQEGLEPQQPAGGLGDIVMVPSVRDARERGVLNAVRPFTRFTSTGVVWTSGTETKIDAVIWCTGFSPALDHLSSLGLIGHDGKVSVNENRSVGLPNLWLVGYGDWTGLASATLIGVTRTARDVVKQVQTHLAESD
ncbi:ArsO family NAD(P)H-dependent flavin-containing monooxygenase [Pseudomonas poae]|uniref:Pyridine nucleotide-disulfide oxidoreductase n=1 Tax=Pseudomonas poae TaxID=200451 RepID=A0A2S9EV34_9PSED|nr:ArsO family NAD(P)H-dependent flavin-containing monooxygenase [Pseudomonas poae]PRA33671.1 pyridine nucleotide-disulfide oxidoreductase [Pseudomonas poae]PRC19739.1 pyridine nucleotide-disulfide oxidoreductase [Pseudomonas poae]